LQEADAAVPAENGVVVSGGANFFGFAEILQCAFEERKQRMRLLADAKPSFGAAFIEDAGVVEAFVGVREFLENFFDFAIAIGGAARELVRDGKSEQAERELLFGVDGENVTANGFGFFRFVEVAVEFDFGESFGDAGAGDGFELVVHEDLQASRAR